MTKAELQEIVLSLPFNVIGIVIDKRDFDFVLRTIELENYDVHSSSITDTAFVKREFQFYGKRIISDK